MKLSILFYVIFSLVLYRRIIEVMKIKNIFNVGKPEIIINQVNAHRGNNLRLFVFLILIWAVVITVFQIITKLFVGIPLFFRIAFLVLLFMNKLGENYLKIYFFSNHFIYGIKVIEFEAVKDFKIQPVRSYDTHSLSIWTKKRTTVIECNILESEKARVQQILLSTN